MPIEADKPPASPSAKGARAELAVATALAETGRAVFVPFFSSHSRVDLIYQGHDGVPRRVQCKSARLVRGVLTFAACSHTGGVERPYSQDADEFGVYCPEMDAVYLIPVAEVPTRVARLRVAEPQNNQSRGVRWAEPYRIRSRGVT